MLHVNERDRARFPPATYPAERGGHRGSARQRQFAVAAGSHTLSFNRQLASVETGLAGRLPLAMTTAAILSAGAVAQVRRHVALDHVGRRGDSRCQAERLEAGADVSPTCFDTRRDSPSGYDILLHDVARLRGFSTPAYGIKVGSKDLPVSTRSRTSPSGWACSNHH